MVAGPLPASEAQHAASKRREELYRQRRELDDQLAALRCHSFVPGTGGCQLDVGHLGPHEAMANIVPPNTAVPVYGRVWWEA